MTPHSPLTRLVIAPFAIAAAALAPSLHGNVERTVEKTFQVQPNVSVSASTSGGEIRVVSSSDSVVKIVATERIRASSDAEADERLKNLDLVIEQKGNSIIAKANYRSDDVFHFGSWPPVAVDFLVTVPSRASVTANTSGGGISVTDLDGPLSAHTSGGGIELGKIGGDADVSTSGGGIRVVSIGGTARLSTSGGNIMVERVGGSADLRTSGGSIVINSVAGALEAHTSGGNVTAGFSAPFAGESSLSTSGGSVRAAVDPKAAFHLDASTSGGDVRADGLTITITHGADGKSSLSGDVNGGGPLLKLRTRGGNIRISQGRLES